MDEIKKCLEVVSGSKGAELVLKNGWIFDVFNQNIYKSSIAVEGGKIVGIGEYEGNSEIDCEGLFVVPAFIDAHVHIESSKMTPRSFAKVLIKRGVTCCIADPHEIANVLGEEGIKFMLQEGSMADIDIYYMMPSCVPAVEFEDNGALLGGDELRKFIDESMVLGLGEVMDAEAVIGGDYEMLKKLSIFNGKVIDGHYPVISINGLNAYSLCGITTDHECSTPKQAIEEIRRGMYVMLREGSAAKNIEKLFPAINDKNYDRFLFCTDDRDINDLCIEGSIDNNIRRAVKLGMDPLKAITAATFNAAQCYGLKHKGAIAPGYDADMVILKNLQDIDIAGVIRNGRLYKENSTNINGQIKESSMNIKPVSDHAFKIKAEGSCINTIRVIPNSIETEKVKREIIIEEGYIKAIKSEDILKIGVFERHQGTGKYSLGFIEGMGIKNCSIAQTIAHDSHNIIVVGDNDKDMEIAVNRVIEMKGGIAIVSSGLVVEELSLPVAGLMTFEEPEYVVKKLNSMKDIIGRYGKNQCENILTTLSFMALPVIPQIKITARGLYDFTRGNFISLFCI